MIDPNITAIQDSIGPSLVAADSILQNNISTGLQVRIAATHAGIVTRNNGFYLPDKMRDGAATFVDQYNKPVLLHHEDHKDPVGRIIKAGYIDTSSSIYDQYAGKTVRDSRGKEVGTITEVLLKDFISGSMPFGQQVDVIRSLFKDSLLDDRSYDGLGHIQIIANITDADAVQKLLDGRYITGSVGATTNRAVCSVCKQDWTKEGKCDHKPGGIYDSAECFIIAGKLFYDEYSFVNVPADRHSKVLELNYNGITDNIDVVDDCNGRVYEVNLEFPQYDSINQEVSLMGKKTKIVDSDATPEVVVVTDEAKPQETPVVDEATATEEVVDETTSEVTDDVSTEPDAEEETVKDLLQRVLTAETLETADEEKLYDAQWAEVESAIKDGTLDKEILEDSKLSADKRKKLPKSVFCGQGRTFPVTDEAHAVATHRLLQLIEDDAKDNVITSVNRKVKAKGWTVTLKDNTETEVNDDMSAARIMHMVLATLEENSYSGDSAPLVDEEKQMLRGLLKRLAGTVGKDEFTQALADENLAIDPTSEQALCEEVEQYETAVGDLTDQLAAVRKEYNSLFQDMETLQDALVDEKSKTRKVQESHLTTLFALRDKKVEEHDFTEYRSDDIEVRITEALGSVDMNKITDKLGDGMTNIPSEEVDDPSELQDNKVQERLTVENIRKVEEHFNKLLFTRGREAAEAYKVNMIREGYLPNINENNQGGSS